MFTEPTEHNLAQNLPWFLQSKVALMEVLATLL